MTHITFERTGGFMGRKVKFEIDLSDLSEEQGEMMEELLDEADFFELNGDMARSAKPDEFIYTITVKKGWFRKHSVRTSDTTAPEDLRPLLDELNQRAQVQR